MTAAVICVAGMRLSEDPVHQRPRAIARQVNIRRKGVIVPISVNAASHRLVARAPEMGQRSPYTHGFSEEI